MGRWGRESRRARAFLRALVAAGVLFTSIVSCARPQGPPGGPPDFIPPMVVSTWPDTFEIIEPSRDPVVIRFSERISERPTRGTLEAAVVVSPATGEADVKHTRGGLEISVIGGFQPGLVYRVRVLPTIKDLFNNPMERPFELVFSTGGAYEENVIAGVTTDLITGEPLEGVRVEAREVGVEDPPVYLAMSDTGGIYLLRYLPSGSFDVSLFEDVNRNGDPDFRELQGRAGGELTPAPSEADTIVQEVALLRPDTTPAEIVRVEALDSAVLEIGFDDFLPAGGSFEEVMVNLVQEDEPGPAIRSLLWEHQIDSLRAFEDSVASAEASRILRDSLQVVADSLQLVLDGFLVAGDSVGADSVSSALAILETRLSPPEPRARPPGAGPPQAPPILPLQSFFALLADPMEPEALYQITVSGVTNVNGLAGGGGEASVSWTPPEEPTDTATVADTATVPDTAGVPPDTAGVPPDTTLVRPDTIADPPKTTGSPAHPSRMHRKRPRP